MKYILRFTILILILANLINCEDKPDKNLYGIPEESKNKILQGILLSYGVIDNRNGTITDTKSGLEWKKCVQGQVFRASNNDCQGGSATATPTTPGDQARYGAIYLSYCNLQGNDCNASSLPMALRASSLPVVSEAFDSCQTENILATNGYTNWRVPSYPELASIAALGKVVLINWFPNTPDDFFWSSWSNEKDFSGSTARAISFSFDKIGEEQNINKTTKLFVRCVRNTNGQ
ncbi:MAG: DUF1566 domain-containing protein [Leptospiraceae bacterium]|nr:DUF1566 domain-containing protein [Leptospiraceae bacterium]